MASADTTHRAECADRVAHHLQHVAREDDVELAFQLEHVALFVADTRAQSLVRMLEARSRSLLKGRRQVGCDHFRGATAFQLARRRRARPLSVNRT